MWAVYNERGVLVSSRDGVSEAQAKEMAGNWNNITNTNWYSAKEMRQEDKLLYQSFTRKR